MSKIAAPRGTADVLPPESVERQAFEARASAIARRFGYGEIRTPIFEATELFVRGVGETTDIVEKEMYTFIDKGDRSLTLRPEWTAPVVRAVLEHNLLQNGPQRLYYAGPIFRYERPQAGRYRQAHQFGVECFGYDDPAADLEIIQLADEILRSYGINARLHLNTIGCSACRMGFRELLITFFRAREDRLSEDSRRRLERNPLRILDSKDPGDRALLADPELPTLRASLCRTCEQRFSRLRALLEEVGIKYEDDPGIVRGLDYYNGAVFEFISQELGAQSTVCAGGRYDGLVSSLGGPATPAVGFAMGVERFLSLARKSASVQSPVRSGIAVIGLGEAARSFLVPLVAELRRLEDAPPIHMEYAEASMSSHFKKAERAGARAAVIVGEDELAAHALTLRDLEKRRQQTISADSPARTARLVLERYQELLVDKAPA